MILTKKQLLRILDEIAYETVFEEAGPNGVRIQRKHTGYSDDQEIIRIQGALSIMLEAADRAEARV